MVYGYVRVSTTGQVPGTSLQEQASQILQKYPTAEITEEAASGAHERPKFDALCNTLTAGDLQNGQILPNSQGRVDLC